MCFVIHETCQACVIFVLIPIFTHPLERRVHSTACEKGMEAKKIKWIISHSWKMLQNKKKRGNSISEKVGYYQHHLVLHILP